MHDSSVNSPGESDLSKPNIRLIAALAAGHLVVDMNQGSLPALLPYLKTALHLSYFASGLLVLAANLTSSVVQPVFGHLADRAARRWLAPVSVLLAGTAFSLTGFADRYSALLVLICLMGLGVACYHPEGFKTSAGAGGARRATAVSWFSLGGSLGFAFGPPVITLLITRLGVRGSLGMLVPSLVVGGMLFFMLSGPASEGSSPRKAVAVVSRGTSMQRAMILLIGIVMIRSWIQLGFMTFLPFYYIDYLKESPQVVGPLLFVFLGAGALGTIIAGPLADRWGARKVMLTGFLASIFPGIAFMYLRGGWAYFALGVFGAVILSTATVTIVLGQQYLPRNPGLASGLIAGFAIGAGGMGVTVLGWVADHFGLPTVLWASTLLLVPGFFACLFLPPPDGHFDNQPARH
jgi:FSR family fosmidomycin resistance protein-like MFS transporter